MELLGEFLKRRALSSAACFVTYRRLPAYKKPNGGRSDPPPYNPRVSPNPVLHSRRYSALSTALSHPASPFSWNRGLEGDKLSCRQGGEREKERERENNAPKCTYCKDPKLENDVNHLRDTLARALEEKQDAPPFIVGTIIRAASCRSSLSCGAVSAPAVWRGKEKGIWVARRTNIEQEGISVSNKRGRLLHHEIRNLYSSDMCTCFSLQ